MSSRSFDFSQIHNYIDSTGADQLDGQHGTYYLDYGNFINTPSYLDSSADTTRINLNAEEAGTALALAIALG